MKPANPSTLPLSLPLPGNRPSGVVVQDGAGDAAEERNPALWPSQNASVVSAGYAFTHGVSTLAIVSQHPHLVAVEPGVGAVT